MAKGEEPSATVGASPIVGIGSPSVRGAVWHHRDVANQGADSLDQLVSSPASLPRPSRRSTVGKPLASPVASEPGEQALFLCYRRAMLSWTTRWGRVERVRGVWASPAACGGRRSEWGAFAARCARVLGCSAVEDQPWKEKKEEREVDGG